MEQQQQQQPGHEVEAISGKSSYQQLSRQSSTRWSPTSEQIRILKELYYNNGVRSPSAEQIQRITAKLRHYGKIEGKNVFYWFQNHKARERQKKRFITTATAPPNKFYHQDHHIISPQPITYYNKFDLVGANNFPSSSSPGLNYGYGSVAMEKSFRECSIGSGSTTEHHHKLTWIGVDPSTYTSSSSYSSSTPYTFLEDQKRKYTTSIVGADHETLEEEEEEEEIETLPLFPMHQDINLQEAHQDYHHYDYYAHFNSAVGCHRPAPTSDVIPTPAAASLELTLNSYI